MVDDDQRNNSLHKIWCNQIIDQPIKNLRFGHGSLIARLNKITPNTYRHNFIYARISLSNVSLNAYLEYLYQWLWRYNLWHAINKRNADLKTIGFSVSILYIIVVFYDVGVLSGLSDLGIFTLDDSDSDTTTTVCYNYWKNSDSRP